MGEYSTEIPKKLRIGLADDHTLVRHGIKTLLCTQPKYEILFDTEDGSEVIAAIKSGMIPDILLLDIEMKKVHGKETCEWITKHAPSVKIIILSMCNDESVILDMIMAGASGYFSKASAPDLLFENIEKLCLYGICFSENLTAKLVMGIRKKNVEPIGASVSLSDNEMRFLMYLCKELTHDEIADKMHLSPRTIDDYSTRLTRKLNVRGKTGLIVYAVTHNLHVSEYGNN